VLALGLSRHSSWSGSQSKSTSGVTPCEELRIKLYKCSCLRVKYSILKKTNGSKRISPTSKSSFSMTFQRKQIVSRVQKRIFNILVIWGSSLSSDQNQSLASVLASARLLQAEIAGLSCLVKQVFLHFSHDFSYLEF